MRSPSIPSPANRFAQDRIDRSGVPNDDRTRAVVSNSNEIYPTYGNMLSHALESLASQPWCDSEKLEEQITEPLLRKLNEIMYRWSENLEEPAKLCSEADYAAKVEFIEEAQRIAGRLIRTFYEPRIQQFEEHIRAEYQRHFSSLDQNTYDAVWSWLCDSKLATDQSENAKAHAFKDIFQAVNDEPFEADEDEDVTIRSLGNVTLNSSHGPAITNALADLLCIPLTMQWNDAINSVNELLNRGIYVTNESRQAVVDMLTR